MRWLNLVGVALFSFSPFNLYAPPNDQYQQFANNRFLGANDRAAIEEFMKLYPELGWLTGKVSGSPDMATGTTGTTLSEQMFGTKQMEFDRTALAILVVKWVLSGDYNQMTSLQNGPAKLSTVAFQRLQAMANDVVPNAEALDAMLVYMAIHDLGKVKNFVEAAKLQTGIETINHDRVFLEVVKKRPDMLPSFNRLSPQYKELITRGLEADFNMGQFLQAENIPASLHGLKGLDAKALDFYMMHVLFDIAGVTGQINTSGSMVMNGPTFNNFELGIRAIEGLSKGRSVEQVYDDYLAEQSKLYGLNVADKVERAAIRICLMIRLAPDKAKAQRVLKALNSLDSDVRDNLIRELNIAGTNDGKAVLPYYAPALLSNAVKSFEAADKDLGLEKALSVGLTMLSDVYTQGRAKVKSLGDRGNGVLTVDIAELAKVTTVHDTAMDFTRHAFDLVFANNDEAKLSLKCEQVGGEKMCSVADRCSIKFKD